MYGRPESSVVVAGRTITAYDVRLSVDQDPELVGRNVVLVRNEQSRLTAAIEGAAIHATALEARLHEQLGVPDIELLWLGGVRLAWGFRQVIDRAEIGLREGTS
jgi:hypothetical protein